MPEITEATRHYHRMFDRRTPEQLHQLAHIKRFMERLVGDAEFRKALGQNLGNTRPVAEAYGIDIDPDQALPLWHRQYLKHRRKETAAEWPLAPIWDEWMDEMIAHRDMIRDTGRCREQNPVFDEWRDRQLMRAESELGTSAGAIVHPIAAYELSEGCSVGCWFCGISADRFKGWLPYTEETARLWRGILQVMVDLFGTAAQTGFCYWATDPSDNPDYPRFIEDHQHITGMLPQTTTAAPLKDIALTREVMGLFDRYRNVTNRFSIVNHKTLKGVHDTFAAEELMGVELVQQQADSILGKADAGRAREWRLRREAEGKAEKAPKLNDLHTTIACVSGFLVSMMDRKVKLVSPTRADDVWPLGYRVYSEAHFETAEEFRAILEEMIAVHMPTTVRSTDTLGFRRDLSYHPLPDGFRLESRTHHHVFTAAPCARDLGDLIARGDMTGGEVIARLVEDGHDVFLAADAVQALFDTGMLNDDPACAGIGSGTLSLVVRDDRVSVPAA